MEGVGGVRAVGFALQRSRLWALFCALFVFLGEGEGLRVGFGFRVLSSRPIRSRLGKSRTSLLHVSWKLLQTSVL